MVNEFNYSDYLKEKGLVKVGTDYLLRTKWYNEYVAHKEVDAVKVLSSGEDIYLNVYRGTTKEWLDTFSSNGTPKGGTLDHMDNTISFSIDKEKVKFFLQTKDKHCSPIIMDYLVPVNDIDWEGNVLLPSLLKHFSGNVYRVWSEIATPYQVPLGGMLGYWDSEGKYNPNETFNLRELTEERPPLIGNFFIKGLLKPKDREILATKYVIPKEKLVKQRDLLQQRWEDLINCQRVHKQDEHLSLA